jgi:predicted nuclease of restriction endonuclease-like RecB superfamily
MLPLNLLRVRTRKGQIIPVYADVNAENLEFARELVSLFTGHVHRRKGNLLEKVAAYEGGMHDYRLVRGLSHVLQRQCEFHVEAPLDPMRVRKRVFAEASRRNVTTDRKRAEVLASVADQLNVTADQLETSLHADLGEELVLERFSPLSEAALLRRYNLALTQTLLFRSTFLEIKVEDGWKDILRQIKFLGMMYSAENRDGQFKVTVDGPFSLFKLTQRYGTRMARILPTITRSRQWELKSSIIKSGQYGKRIYQLQLTSRQVGDIIRADPRHRDGNEVSFDSHVEAKFHNDFQALRSGWKLRREPTPLVAGTHVFLPDFSFEKRGLTVYLEIVGFWTRKYLETKLKKLEQLQNVDLLVAADQKLACDRLRRVHGNIIFYTRTVPSTKILRLLQRREEALLESEIQTLDAKQLRLEGDIVELQRLADQHGVSMEAVRASLKTMDVDDYTLAGGAYIRNAKLEALKLKLEALTDPSLQQALHLLEHEGVKEPYAILSALDYGIRWNGLDTGRSSIYKRERH